MFNVNISARVLPFIRNIIAGVDHREMRGNVTCMAVFCFPASVELGLQFIKTATVRRLYVHVDFFFLSSCYLSFAINFD